MSAQEATPPLEKGVGTYALGVATMYAFAGFVVRALVARARKGLSLGFGPAMSQALSGDRMSLTGVSHPCPIGLGTVGTSRWNFGGLAHFRRNRLLARLPRPGPLPVLAPEGSIARGGVESRVAKVCDLPPFARLDPWSGRRKPVLTGIVRSCLVPR